MENYNKIENYDWGTCYFLNGKLHRLDGSAVEDRNGTKCWFQNGLRHRIDGPAVEFSDGDKYWYYEGKYVVCNSQEEFERLIKLKLFW
jgi:hypothetical protein